MSDDRPTHLGEVETVGSARRVVDAGEEDTDTEKAVAIRTDQGEFLLTVNDATVGEAFYSAAEWASAEEPQTESDP